MNLHHQFMPITKNPVPTEAHVEILPCSELRPYIRCFWGSPKPHLDVDNDTSIIIPDGCMDIVSHINYSKQTCDSHLCGLNDAYFEYVNDGTHELMSTFGIRFHFWSAHLFLKDNYKLIANQFIDLKHFNTRLMIQLHHVLIEHEQINDRVRAVEQLLRDLLYDVKLNNDLLNGVHHIVTSKGIVKINELSEGLGIGQRKLERLFSNHIGLSPKKMADIVRFQNVWQDIYYKRSDHNLDLTYHYEYNSESHFITNFKKYFGQTPMKVMSIF